MFGLKTILREAFRLARYRASRNTDSFAMMPMNVTCSVTNLCNSRCKTCFIWKLYRERPSLKERELKLWEFERIFKSLGTSVVYLTFSGGEPFLRKDLSDICISAYEQCRPRVVTIPTNALLPNIIESELRRILRTCETTVFTVNLSLDGVGRKHDEIRGVRRNFASFMDTFGRLSRLKEEFRNLIVGVHSVLSVYSLDSALEVYEFARRLGPDSYIMEVAEERAELFNQESGVTPPPEDLARVLNKVRERIKRDYLARDGLLGRFIQASRLAYYDVVPRILEKKRQIYPCYAGFASCQITPHGDVWPCCILGYDKPMGNLRDDGYDFRKIWLSQKAEEVRKFVRSGGCSCPLANASYTSMLCSPTYVMKILAGLLASYV